ncbi:hypothetical protein BDP27DRAFT_1345955 [Rhodocollybia butyracea]|uniref:Uncharacterized protein n=1 Tax=Rhodocollybia butyracea TaxID=206335 RepID=A0A9P5P2V0_9AGAR|nr:hypothetical protein BDP27DRAFT_1345955 [Rhodocollybia butyracea]
MFTFQPLGWIFTLTSGRPFWPSVTFWVSKLFFKSYKIRFFSPRKPSSIYRPITGYQRLSLEHGLEIGELMRQSETKRTKLYLSHRLRQFPPSEDTAAADIAALLRTIPTKISMKRRRKLRPSHYDQISDVKSPTKQRKLYLKSALFGILHGPEYGRDVLLFLPQWDDTSDESYYNSNASGFSSAYDYDIGSDSSDW